ncbi:type II toxin-antitoxin system YafO family toxin [Escherichia coli]|nr:type II toxin-antitoxin system YafO family toxin [Escherichia coli]MDE7981017.1 type II toxin-antitoxin system YafO family toxin [Escherichia coli]
MQISVTYHPETYEHFFAPVFAVFPELEQSIIKDFTQYKATGMLPGYFGRDTLYDRPEDVKDAKMWHLHLELGNNKFPKPSGRMSTSTDQVTLQWYRTSDSCLVYAQNELNENCYSLLAVFHPYAHEEARNYRQIRYLAGLAREFKEQFII